MPPLARLSSLLAGASLTVLTTLPSAAFDVRVTVENLSPTDGTLITPVWAGFHDGTFDLYNQNEAASAALERLAEDGNTGPLSALFGTAALGGVDATLLAGGAFPPFAPGASASMDFSLDRYSAAQRYFSYASMVIPSNDAFIANGNPLAFPIFDPSGNFLGADFVVMGSMVLDAGTEVNDELPVNTAFLGQAAPDTGTTENGTVMPHAGFKPVGAGGILDGSFGGFGFSAADFTAPGYQLARIRVTAVPEGTHVLGETLLAGSLLTLGLRWRRWVQA